MTRVAGKVASLDSRLQARIEALFNDYLALEDLCGACKRAAIPLQVPFTLDAAGAAQLAYTVRTHCGIGSAVVFDYIELLENHGLRILFVDLPEAVESLSFHDAVNANAFLVLGDGYNPEKQLFRMAVELANVYLFTANRCSPVAETPTTRRFAKTFASLFLMPLEAVRATVMQLGVGPKEWTYELLLRIKHRFGVSAEAFAHRLEEVGALDPGLRQEFKARIQAHYEATGFGEPDSSRRILSRNGRLGDLLLCARRNATATDELAAIAKRRASKPPLRPRPLRRPAGAHRIAPR
jgi:Zn-dependent peptidase ImmA (M78 family)